MKLVFGNEVDPDRQATFYTLLEGGPESLMIRYQGYRLGRQKVNAEFIHCKHCRQLFELPSTVLACAGVYGWTNVFNGGNSLLFLLPGQDCS